MTLIWPSKVTKGQTDYGIGFATYHFLYVFYSNYSAISHENPVFQQMTSIRPFKVTKVQTEYAIRFATYHFLYVIYSNYSAISHGNPVFSRWPWTGLSRSPKVKLNMPFNLRHIISYTCSIVTIALSRTETLFFSRWPWSGFSRSPKVKLIMPFDPWHITSYKCFIVTIALSRTETLFFSRWPRSILSVTKCQTDYPFLSFHQYTYFVCIHIFVYT